jgi:glycine/D-amino acid oxidase-like deaminating enzyme
VVSIIGQPLLRILLHDFEFRRRDSLYFSNKEDVKKLQKDNNYLKNMISTLIFFLKNRLVSVIHLKRSRALYFYNDGEMTPFKYVHGLFKHAHQKGIRIFEQTKITGYDLQNDKATFFTKNGHSIKARYAIVSAGYEGSEFKNEENNVIASTYSVVTNPIENFSSWYNRTLIWESARPYLYMRTTNDNRIMIGGLDEFTISTK